MVAAVGHLLRSGLMALVAAQLDIGSANAHPQTVPGEEIVIVSSGGEYVSYPASAWRQDGNARVYGIDMSKALTDHLPEGDTLEIEMSWASDDQGDVVCFMHREKSNCRTLFMDFDEFIQPRFMPTVIADPPGLYVRFKDVGGETVLLQYIDGAIRTPDEWFAEING